MTAWPYGEQATAELGALTNNLLETEQYLDYLGMRFFRRTLLCRQEVNLRRHFEGRCLDGCWLAPRFVRMGPGEIRVRGNIPIDISDPLVDAVLDIVLCYPAGIYLDRLLTLGAEQIEEEPTPEQLAAVQTTLLELYAMDALELGRHRRPWIPVVDKRPRTSSFARRYASTGNSVTTLKHRNITVDLLDRAILLRLDGRHIDDIYTAIWRDLTHQRLEVTIKGAPVTGRDQVITLVNEKLERFAEVGLLMAPGTVDVGHLDLDEDESEPTP